MQSEICVGGLPVFPGPVLTAPDFTLYGDGTLIYGAYDDEVPGYLRRGKLTETAIQEVLRRAVDEARFFDSKDRYAGDTSLADGSTTCITVHTVGESRSVSAYSLQVLSPKSPQTSSMTSEDLKQFNQDLEQFNQLAEFNRWLLELDLRELDSPDWVDLGPFIPEAISLTILPVYESTFARKITPWPFSEIDLEPLPPPSIGTRGVVLDGDLAREVDLFLSAIRQSVFSQGDVLARFNYRPHLPYEEQ